MSNETLFYIFGIATASFAVIVSFFGLRVRSFPGRAMPAVVLAFAVLVGASTTFGVLNAQDEEEARAAEHAAEAAEAEATEGGEAAAPEGGATEGGEATQQPVKGPGGTLKLSADTTALLFDKTKLTSKPGKVTIDFTNPAAIEHDVAILKDGQELAKSPLISQSKTSVSADLAPGTYTFLCTVPGHADGGMKGTLTVK
jgi:plastocyanin